MNWNLLVFGKYCNLIGPLRYVATLYTTKNSSGEIENGPVVVCSFFKKPIDICISKESA